LGALLYFAIHITKDGGSIPFKTFFGLSGASISKLALMDISNKELEDIDKIYFVEIFNPILTENELQTAVKDK
jgi:hypothetical protein